MVNDIYHISLITNGWFAPIESKSPFLGYRFHPSPKLSIGLNCTFDYVSAHPLSVTEIQALKGLEVTMDKSTEKELEAFKKSLDLIPALTASTQHAEAQAEQALATRNYCDAFNDLKTKADNSHSNLAVFKTSIGLAGFKIPFTEAAKVPALLRQGCVVTFDFNDDGSEMSAIVTRPRTLNIRTIPKRKMVI